MLSIAVAIAAVLLAGCSAAPPLPSGAMAVPTDQNVVPSAGTHILCSMNATDPPMPVVEGVLDGVSSDPTWPVWLRTDAGQRVYVRWPAGFSVRFDPTPTLLDESGAVFVHAGSPVSLNSGIDPSLGTKDRPYQAVGTILTGIGHEQHCYIQKQ